MTPEEWEKIETAFQHAISLDESALADYLSHLEEQDPGLCEKVQRMLDEDRDPSDLLREPVVAAAASFAESGPDRWIGRSFGNYRAVRKIASCGMSAV